jgi:hypothetical protein
MAISTRSKRTAIAAVLPISDWPLWLSVVGCLGLVLVWAPAVEITFQGTRVLGIVIGLLAVNLAYRWLRPGPVNPVSTMIETAAVFIAFTAVWVPITYLTARNDHTLVDASLVRFDRSLGFDWDRWAAFVRSVPGLDAVLVIAYGSITVQVVAAILWLPLVQGGRRGFELVRHGVLAIALTCALFRFLPALAPTDGAWMVDFRALRGPAPLVFQLDSLQGIISFPSFHTVLGILFVHAFRHTLLQGPALLLNGLMILSALNVGGHYLADIVGGAAVALVAILAGKGLGRMLPL